MNSFANYVLSRANEASTWRGIVLLLTAFGIHLGPEQAEAVIVLGLGTAGVIGALFPNRLFSTRTRKTDSVEDGTYPPDSSPLPPPPVAPCHPRLPERATPDRPERRLEPDSRLDYEGWRGGDR